MIYKNFFIKNMKKYYIEKSQALTKKKFKNNYTIVELVKDETCAAVNPQAKFPIVFNSFVTINPLLANAVIKAVNLKNIFLS